MAALVVQVVSVISTIGCVLFAIQGLRRPLMMAAYAVAMLPIQIACPIGLGLKVNELAIILWIIVFLVHITIRKEIFRSQYGATIFVAVLLVSFFNIFKYLQTGNSGVIVELIRLWVAITFPLTIALLFFDELEDLFDSFIRAWSCAATIISCLSLFSVVANGYSFLDYLLSYITKTRSFYVMKFAASPFIADPNSYGGYLVISIGIACYLYRTTREKKYLVSVIIEAVGLITSLSRGAILSLVIAFSIILFINRKTKALGAFAIIIGIVCGVSLLIPYFQNDMSAMSRFEMWGTALSMFKDHPILGVGLNNYTYLFSNYGIAGVLGFNPYTHNLYLKILVETGIVGEFLFLALVFTTIRLCIRYAQVDGKAMMILFGILGFMVQGMIVEFFTSNYFWFMLIAGLLYMQRVDEYYRQKSECYEPEMTVYRGCSQ